MRAPRPWALAAVALVAPLAACTIPSDGDAGSAAGDTPSAVTVTATETQVQDRETTVTETETATVAETTLTTTATRWAIGDPAEATNPNEQLFGPYPSQEHCEGLADAECEERDDGWYLDLRSADEGDEGDTEDPEDAGSDPGNDPGGDGSPEPASPSESGPDGDTD